MDDCPSGFYADIEQQDCVPCHADCASCDGPDVDDCNACLDPSAVRYKGKCLPECPASTFHDMDIDECRGMAGFSAPDRHFVLEESVIPYGLDGDGTLIAHVLRPFPQIATSHVSLALAPKPTPAEAAGLT